MVLASIFYQVRSFRQFVHSLFLLTDRIGPQTIIWYNYSAVYDTDQMNGLHAFRFFTFSVIKFKVCSEVHLEMDI